MEEKTKKYVVTENPSTWELPLTTEQTYMVDYQFYTPKSTMYNLGFCVPFLRKEIDIERMAEAINTALRNHPALMSSLRVAEDGMMLQRYTPELFQGVKVEEASEEEVAELKETFIHPFKLFGNLLISTRLLLTDNNLYFFFQVHHVFFDGVSSIPFFNNIARAYDAKKLRKDDYYGILQKRFEAENSKAYLEAKAYFESMYEGIEWIKCLKIDHESRDNILGTLDSVLQIDSSELKKYLQGIGFTKTVFFSAVGIITLHILSNYDNIKITGIHNGREGLIAMHRVGLYFREIPVAIRFSDTMDIIDIFTLVQSQLKDGIRHSCYPYEELNPAVVKNDVTCILYQGNIYDTTVASFNKKIECLDSQFAAAENLFSIEIMDGESGLNFNYKYAASLYEESTIEGYKNLYETIALLLADGNENLTMGELKEKLKA